MTCTHKYVYTRSPFVFPSVSFVLLLQFLLEGLTKSTVPYLVWLFSSVSDVPLLWCRFVSSETIGWCGSRVLSIVVLPRLVVVVKSLIALDPYTCPFSTRSRWLFFSNSSLETLYTKQFVHLTIFCLVSSSRKSFLWLI